MYNFEYQKSGKKLSLEKVKLKKVGANIPSRRESNADLRRR